MPRRHPIRFTIRSREGRMSFRVGQRVVCIDPTWGSGGTLQHRACPNLPSKGQTYTIRDLMAYRCRKGDDRDTLFLRLVEVVNPINVDGFGRKAEPVFEASKYRPLIVRKTDISIFTKLLAPKELERVP